MLMKDICWEAWIFPAQTGSHHLRTKLDAWSTWSQRCALERILRRGMNLFEIGYLQSSYIPRDITKKQWFSSQRCWHMSGLRRLWWEPQNCAWKGILGRETCFCHGSRYIIPSLGRFFWNNRWILWFVVLCEAHGHAGCMSHYPSMRRKKSQRRNRLLLLHVEKVQIQHRNKVHLMLDGLCGFRTDWWFHTMWTYWVLLHLARWNDKPMWSACFSCWWLNQKPDHFCLYVLQKFYLVGYSLVGHGSIRMCIVGVCVCV